MQRRRLLIIGCGDVAQRAVPWLAKRFKVYALTRTPESAASLRQLGVTPIMGNLDDAASLARLAGVAEWVLHSAPPPNAGTDDARTHHLLAALARGAILPRGFVYISTTGVYGDCVGTRIDETRPCHPESARAQRRVTAEAALRAWGRRHGGVAILRAPGIYAADRLPIERIRQGSPALLPEEDGYSNHIHADDLAHAAALALFRGRTNRVYNTCDDTEWKMGDWFDRVADAYALPRPPRLSRVAMQANVSPALWSFMRESRRIANGRLKDELKLRLRHPTPDGLLASLSAGLGSVHTIVPGK